MSDVTVTYRPHPLRMDAETTHVEPGARLSEIVAGLGIANKWARQVVVAVNGQVIPEPLRRAVRPKGGTFVTVVPVQGRNELALVAALTLAVAAPWAGAAAFGSGFGTAGATAGFFGTSALGASLVTAGVTVAGSLLINQLLAPPQPRLNASQAAPRYDIGGSGNRVALYEPVPLVIGRHQMFPVKTATPYTQTNGSDVWLHERMTFGYGRVALEGLRIGETPIHLFDDVQIEFRNVDRTQTIARYPEIDQLVTFWRANDDTMTLHPDDIVQDSYNVPLVAGEETVRSTRVQARRAEVELSAPRGLFNTNSKGAITSFTWSARVDYRLKGASTWKSTPEKTIQRTQREPFRLVFNVDFPSPGQYELRVRRFRELPHNGAGDVVLAAVRTVQAGKLPSQPELAEVALRIRASEQLNGPIDQLSGVVNRMVPIWTGTTWTSPQITSHPAWHIADLLRGPMRRDPVPSAKIDRTGLKAWADEEPQRRCDYVADSAQTVRQLGDLIAAAGRAKFDFNGRYRVIRDQADGPVRQLFTPRNSWGFSGQINLPKPIHALRVQAMSERANWQMDEVLVYADGFNAGNATLIEPLETAGTVIRYGETTGGEAWRLGRYHLAQHQLRFETFTLNVDLEHLVTGMGDKVRIVHDMPSIGVGQGRVKSITTSGGNLATITLDDVQDVDAGTYHLTIRRMDGGIVEATATGGDLSPVWTISGTVSAAGIGPGDLVAIREIATASFDCIIKRITSLDNLQATLELVPAAPGVLTADQGIIPPYDPGVSTADRSGRPRDPVVTRVFSGETAALRGDGTVADRARVGVEVQSQSSQQVPASAYRVWWRVEGRSEWQGGELQAVAPTLYTSPLDRQQRYDVEVQAVAQTGQEGGRVRVGTVFAFVDDGKPDVVPDLRATVLGAQATLRWGRPTRNVDFYVVRHSSDPLATWGESQQIATNVRDEWVAVPAFNGVYHVRAINYDGDIGETSATVQITAGVLNSSKINTLEAHPSWTGDATGTATVVGSSLAVSATGNSIYDWSNIWDVGDIYTTGEVAGAGVFEMDGWATLASVQTVRVSAEVRGGAASTSSDIWAFDDVWGIADIYAGSDTSWAFRVEISTTQGGGSTPVWADWEPLFAGDYRFRQARFRLVVEIEDDEYVVTINELTITVGNT